VFFGCEEEDGEDEFAGEKHFEEEAAGLGGVAAESGVNVERTW